MGSQIEKAHYAIEEANRDVLRMTKLCLSDEHLDSGGVE